MNELTRTSLITNPNEITQTLHCPICLDLIMAPIECHECSKLFCKDCINNWLNNSPNKECPNKHRFIKKSSIDEWAQKALQKIYLKCPYKTCESEYAYSLWPNHVKVCPAKIKGVKGETERGDDDIYKDKDIQFFVRDLQNRSYVFNLPISTTIKELKERIKDKTGINARDQRLIGNGKNLEDNKTLEFYYIQNNSNISLVMRLKGG